jgi:signal peptidase I
MDSEKIQASGNGKKLKIGFEVLQWVLVILGAFLVAILIRGFVFEFVMVDGPSMQNTLHTGERLLVYKLGYNFSPPERGDIIVFQYQKGEESFIPFLEGIPLINDLIPEKDEVDYIKRAIAIPGDEVDIRDGFIYINGKKNR